MKIELVVFDMAGTTVRDDDAVNNCLRHALAAASLNVTRDQINKVMGIAKPLAIRKLLERHRNGNAVSAELVNLIHEDFLRRMLNHYRTNPKVEPMPHTMEVFGQLKEAGVRIALDTGFSRPIANAVLDRLGWHDSGVLDATVTSDEVQQGRPHPDLLFKAMERTGVKSAQAVVKVGDTPADLGEGAAAGSGLNIAVTNGSHTARDLEPHPHTHLISDLRELPALVLNHI
jgi:phosphonatase-like hydrolase